MVWDTEEDGPGPPKAWLDRLPKKTPSTLASYNALLCLGALHASDDNQKTFTADELIAGVKVYCGEDDDWTKIEADLREILEFFEIIKKVGKGYKLR